MLADYPWDGEASTLDWSETYSLHAAAEAGLVDEVRRLLDLAVDLTDAHEPHRGWTPLQYALAGSHEAVVVLLLERGASAHNTSLATGEPPCPPLLLAFNSGNCESQPSARTCGTPRAICSGSHLECLLLRVVHLFDCHTAGRAPLHADDGSPQTTRAARGGGGGHLRSTAIGHNKGCAACGGIARARGGQAAARPTGAEEIEDGPNPVRPRQARASARSAPCARAGLFNRLRPRLCVLPFQHGSHAVKYLPPSSPAKRLAIPPLLLLPSSQTS